MTERTLPDRNRRPGGRWSAPRLAEDLLRLAALERAAAHVIAGRVAKLPGLDRKIALAASLETHMGLALALRRHALRLLERDETGLRVSAEAVALFRALDASENPEEISGALSGDLASFLIPQYRALEAALDPLYDTRLISTLREAIAAFDSFPRTATLNRSAFLRELEDAWDCDGGPLVHLDSILWPPRDRVAVPARPAGRARPEAGARAMMRTKSRREPSDVAAELNDNVMAELSAMELLARCSYEHPDLPWPFHMALAAHVSDEARHAAIFRRLLQQRGFSESDLPQHASNYEYAYAFPECEPGSKHELLWRILIMCTILEGLAIDKLPVEIAARDALDQPDIARALDYIAADELFHAENGLRLSRQLCDTLKLDCILERERAHGRFFGRQRNVRARYLQADPQRAAQEIAIIEGPDQDGLAFLSQTEFELRRRASYTDEDCAQIHAWGYNPAGAAAE